MSEESLAPLGIFGGTFDPVHYGHLRPALELREQLRLGEVRFIPAAQPPHRGTPTASSGQRLVMLQRAVAGIAGFTIDERELQRSGPSYMVDTLRSLRNEVGERPLVLLLGLDAFLGLPGWHQWQELTSLAHIAVATRPGWEREQLQARAELHELLALHGSDDPVVLRQSRAGRIVMAPVTPLAISATMIRERLREGFSVRFLLPDDVLSYIEEKRLYLS